MGKGYRKKGIGKQATRNMRRVNARPYTYIIEAEGSGRIKIGQTKHLSERLEQLQSKSPVAVRLLRKISGMEHKAILCRKLKPFKGDGEWYEKTPELVKFVNQYWRSDLDFQPIDHGVVLRRVE